MHCVIKVIPAFSEYKNYYYFFIRLLTEKILVKFLKEFFDFEIKAN